MFMEKYSQVIFDKNTVEFVTVAAEYCGFLERARDMKRYDFVDTALKILPLLYLKATLLPPCEPIGEDGRWKMLMPDRMRKQLYKLKSYDLKLK